MQHSQDFYINGQWVAPLEGRPFDVINPSNEEIAGTISLGGKADTDAAVAAAKAAFATWRRSSMSERMDLLETILGIYKRRADDMAEAISVEMGPMLATAKAPRSRSCSSAPRTTQVPKLMTTSMSGSSTEINLI